MLKTADDYRLEGWTVAFRFGLVLLYNGGNFYYAQPVDNGAWQSRPDAWQRACEGVMLEDMMNARGLV